VGRRVRGIAWLRLISHGEGLLCRFNLQLKWTFQYLRVVKALENWMCDAMNILVT